MRSLTIIETVLYQLFDTCYRVYPYEACGLLGGRGDVAHTLYPLRNVAAAPTDNFLGDPQDHLSAVRQMEAREEDLVGIYHSHPQTDPFPSQEDIKQATYPQIPYVIVSLANGLRPWMRTFLLSPGHMRAVEILWYVQR